MASSRSQPNRLGSLFGWKMGCRPKRRRRSNREATMRWLRLEPLEERYLLAVLSPDGNADVVATTATAEQATSAVAEETTSATNEEAASETAEESFEELDVVAAVDEGEEGGLEFDLDDFIVDLDEEK